MQFKNKQNTSQALGTSWKTRAHKALSSVADHVFNSQTSIPLQWIPNLPNGNNHSAYLLKIQIPRPTELQSPAKRPEALFLARAAGNSCQREIWEMMVWAYQSPGKCHSRRVDTKVERKRQGRKGTSWLSKSLSPFLLAGMRKRVAQVVWGGQHVTIGDISQSWGQQRQETERT